jgi:hypothetical protein
MPYIFQIKTTINFSKAYKYHIPLWALVNGPLQTELVKEDKTSIQHARDIGTLRMRRNFICVLLRLRLLLCVLLRRRLQYPRQLLYW